MNDTSTVASDILTATSATSPATSPRLSVSEVAPDLYKAQLALETAVRRSGIDPMLYELIKIRASQINGCSFCLDMHTREASKLGETDRRLHLLAAWRETGLFTPRERAALALTEAVTLLSTDHVPDAVWDDAARHFEPTELSAVLMGIVVINGWNRITIASRTPLPD
jgi:AhpD family alkylhydroperoxidase